jgi:hypothetical protein
MPTTPKIRASRIRPEDLQKVRASMAPPPKAGEVHCNKLSLGINQGFDDNVVGATLECLDSLIMGKLGSTSSFSITVVEVCPPDPTLEA